MDSLINLLHGLEHALTVGNLLYCLLGVTIGMLVGVLPGLGPISGSAILIPLTFSMEPVQAIIMLAGIFYGTMYGGTITSVLINTPGEVASVITCLDGYQMARQGRAGTALGIAAIGSFIGGIVAVAAMVLVGPPLAKFALTFGPPEYFALLMVGLTMLIAMLGRSIIRGMVSAVIGLLLSMVGMDPISGVIRFNFGTNELMDGIDFVVIAMGLFGISEILLNLENKAKMPKPTSIGKLLPNREEWKPSLKAIGRGTGIGLLLGLIPGANSVIASILSYTVEKKTAKDPSRFGKGAIEGVAGPESANNAHSGSAMIPLFTLGIPGSPTVAIIFGAFIIHGITPGPQLFESNSTLVWTVIASMIIGNIILLILNLPLVRMWAKVANIPYTLLFPFILVFCLIGAYSISNSVFDLQLMALFGVIGYLMRKLDIPTAPLILTVVLGSQIESSFLQSLTMSRGNMMIFLERPISAALLILCLAIMAFNIVSAVKKKRTMLASDLE